MRLLKNQELAAFCNQFSMILQSGISSMEGLSLLLEDAQNEEEKKLLQLLYDEVCQTGELASAFEKTKQFPTYFIHMVRMGEETGSLDDVMESLASYYEREYLISLNIRNAFTYPMIMIGMVIFIIILLLTKVLPIFEQVFLQFGREMTGIAKGFLFLGNFLSDYLFFVLLLLLIFIYGSFTYIKKKSSLKPLVSASRFSSCMALTLKSGLVPERGFEFAEEMIEDTAFQQKLQAAKESFVVGETLANALQQSGIFTGTNSRLLAIANKTGYLEQAMEKIAASYEEEIHTKITSFIATLEPTLVIILSCIVGIILFSVMFPLLGIMTSL